VEGRGKPGDESVSRDLPRETDSVASAAVSGAAAFQGVYEGTFDEVYAYLFHRCGGLQSMAEDLTQETYLAAVAAFRGGDGANVSLPWLITVARNKLVDHYRRREREERRLSLIVNDQTSRDTAHLNGQIPRERALTALASVPAEQRAALVLKYLDDLPVSEVAELLGKSVHATESLLARGRRTLKRRFEEVLDD
jgi:RNA polymerase sigma-70 factor (ECF subfamily)